MQQLHIITPKITLGNSPKTFVTPHFTPQKKAGMFFYI